MAIGPTCRSAFAMSMWALTLLLVVGSQTSAHTLPWPSLHDPSQAPSADVPRKQSVDPTLETLLGIHTIVYNRTFNPDDKVVAVYTPTSFQYSPGEYLSFTTASNDELRFTPTSFYLNNLGFPYEEAGSSPPTDGIVRLTTHVDKDPGGINGWSLNVHNPSCVLICG